MENTEEEIHALLDSWIEAELSGNAEFMENVLTHDFIGIGPFGFLLTKKEWIDRHAAGDLKYTSLRINETKLRIYTNQDFRLTS